MDVMTAHSGAPFGAALRRFNEEDKSMGGSVTPKDPTEEPTPEAPPADPAPAETPVEAPSSPEENDDAEKA